MICAYCHRAIHPAFGYAVNDDPQCDACAAEHVANGASSVARKIVSHWRANRMRLLAASRRTAAGEG